jgi:hypothetical protein
MGLIVGGRHHAGAARRMHEEASAEYARLVEEANRTVTASAGG